MIKKETVKRFKDTVRKLMKQTDYNPSDSPFDILVLDIRDSAEGKGWETLDIWAEESNELARLILLYADKSAGNMDNISKIFRYLRRFKGQGIVTEEVLSKFYLKK